MDRTIDIAASMTNHEAIIDDDSSAQFRLAEITAPTLVLHGTADPLFRFGHGEALAAEIPGARLVALDGIGHQTPPPQLWEAIVRHTAGER